MSFETAVGPSCAGTVLEIVSTVGADARVFGPTTFLGSSLLMLFTMMVRAAWAKDSEWLT
jgi:hypothetical protein